MRLTFPLGKMKPKLPKAPMGALEAVQTHCCPPTPRLLTFASWTSFLMKCELNRDAKRFLCHFPFFQGLMKALGRFPGSPGAVSRQPWPSPHSFRFHFQASRPGFLNIAPDNQKGLLGMAAAPDQLLGCLSGRGRSRTDRQRWLQLYRIPCCPCHLRPTEPLVLVFSQP